MDVASGRPTPTVRTGVLIRRPMDVVWNAFVDPAVTSRFWFSASSGILAPGADVVWTWAPLRVSTTVRVLEFDPGRALRLRWGSDGDGTELRWLFDRRSDTVTSVRIEEAGFDGPADEVLARVLDATIVLTKMLVAAKAWLEFEVTLDVVS